MPVLLLSPEPFVLVDNGTVLGLISRPDPLVARIFSLEEEVAEFPVVVCIRTDEFDVSQHGYTTLARGIV